MSGELISRHGARLALARLRSDHDYDYNAIVDKCINAVSQVPVRAKRKVAEWKPTNLYSLYLCSECGGRSILQTMFCPDCGARMEVDE